MTSPVGTLAYQLFKRRKDLPSGAERIDGYIDEASGTARLIWRSSDPKLAGKDLSPPFKGWDRIAFYHRDDSKQPQWLVDAAAPRGDEPSELTTTGTGSGLRVDIECGLRVVVRGHDRPRPESSPPYAGLPEPDIRLRLHQRPPLRDAGSLRFEEFVLRLDGSPISSRPDLGPASLTALADGDWRQITILIHPETGGPKPQDGYPILARQLGIPVERTILGIPRDAAHMGYKHELDALVPSRSAWPVHDDHILVRFQAAPVTDLIPRLYLVFRRALVINDAVQVEPPSIHLSLSNQRRRRLLALVHRQATDLWATPFDPDAEPRSIVSVEGVDATDAMRFWNDHIVLPYLALLRTSDGRESLSAIPLFHWRTTMMQGPLFADGVRGGWRLAFEYRDVAFEAAQPDLTGKGLRWLTALPLEEGYRAKIDVEVPAMRDLDGKPVRFAGELTPRLAHRWKQATPAGEPIRSTAQDEERIPGLILDLAQLQPSADVPVQRVRAGALDLLLPDSTAAVSARWGDIGVSDSRFRAEFRRDIGDGREEEKENSLPDYATLAKPYTWLDLNARYGMLALMPGAQDPLPRQVLGDDTDALDPALVVPLGLSQANEIPVPGERPRLWLRVEETASARRPRSLALRIKMFERAEMPLTASRFLVVDRNPFLVAKVVVGPLIGQASDEDNEIAKWVGDDLDGASWELANVGVFVLLLPPQGIGETMERGSRDVDEGKAVDFRFSPPALFRLQPSYFEQRFGEVPWNLRRILGYPGQRAPGAGIVNFRFELFYGMTGLVEHGALRLAELAARIGQLTGEVYLPIERADSGEPLPEAVVKRARKEYHADWRRQRARYAARLSVLEPWDPGRPDDLRLEDGVRFKLRSDADLRYPVEPDPYEQAPGGPPNPNVPRNDGGLAGGVAWPFQSSNIYESVWRDPVSNTARLSDARFSALGGWGKQKATFDNERTTIYADVAMGRTYYVSVERIGRIGVFWNRAKHVVVYERTTSPTEQFYATQDRHVGRPVLRKVREYVEILQPERRYPEFGAARVTRGFVIGCDFVNAIIPVDSSWGRDVRDVGWEVPLWVPPATGGEPQAYPKPQITLRVAVDPETGEESSTRELAEPENLVFFTNTQASFGADTDAWPAVVGVDYPDQPTPRPADVPAGDPRNLDRRLPDAAAVAAGFARFTFPVLPDERQVDMLAERGEKSIGSVLHNVTMMRARPRADSTALASPVRQAMAAAATAERLPEEVRGIVQDIRSVVDSWADGGKLTAAAVAEIKRHIADVGADLGRLGADAGAMLDQAGNLFKRPDGSYKNPCDLAKEEIKNGLARTRERAGGLLDRLQADLFETIDELLAQGQQDLTVVASIVDGIFAQLLGLPRAAGTEIGVMRATIRRIEVEIDGAFAAVAADIDAMLAAVGKAATLEQRSAEIRVAARRFVGRLETLETKLAGMTRGRYVKLAKVLSGALRTVRVPLASALDELERRVAAGDETLGELFDGLDASVDEAASTIAGVVHQPLQEVDRVFGAVESRILELIGSVDAIRVRQTEFVGYVQLALRGNATRAKSDIVVAVDRWRRDIGTAADALETSIVEELEQGGAIGALCEQFFGNEDWQQTIDNARAWLADPVKGLLQGVEGYVRENVDVDQIRRDIDAFADELQGELNGLAERLAPSLREQLRAAAQLGQDIGALGDALHQVGDSTLQLVRAFARKPDLSDFNRENLGYFYDELKNAVDLTPVTALVNRIGDNLKGLGIRLPSRQLLDQIIPDSLEGLKFSDIFPDFSGLRALLPNLRLPNLSSDKVKVSQGIDRQSRRAWVQADVDFKIKEPTPLFDYGPVKVTLVAPHFSARSRTSTGLDGQVENSMHGEIVGHWDLEVGGVQIVRFRDTPLIFDDQDGVRFELDPRRVEMQAALQFLSDLTEKMQALQDELAGLGIEIIRENGLPIGAASRLNIPVPDVQLGAFGITNMHFGAAFELVAVPDFSISTRFYLGRSTAPFNLTIFILGGGGWVDISARYLPLTGRIRTELSIAIGASAMLALNLGVIRGGVLIYFGVNLIFYSDSAGEDALTVSILLLIEGSASLAGLVTVGVSLRLEATYRKDGSLTGTGTLSYRIKICWCFTLKVEQRVTYRFMKGSGSTGAAQVTDDPDLRRRRRAEMRAYLAQFA
jgi:hypothetical protein